MAIFFQLGPGIRPLQTFSLSTSMAWGLPLASSQWQYPGSCLGTIKVVLHHEKNVSFNQIFFFLPKLRLKPKALCILDNYCNTKL